uniref:Glycosyltransferase N-terminal domain-containing protein n=1 Tax=Oryza barthii TaxID=65489 RepID=A0A0D3GR41_9ORYZ
MGTAPAPAHVLVFPWPIQGHLNVMLHLAVALAGAGVHVTFLHTDYNLRRHRGGLAMAPA